MAMPWQKAFTARSAPHSVVQPGDLSGDRVHTFGHLLTADRSEALLSLREAVSLYALSSSHNDRRPSKFLATQKRARNAPSVPYGTTRIFIGPEDRLQLGMMLIDRLQGSYLRPAVVFARMVASNLGEETLPTRPSEVAQYLFVLADQLPEDAFASALRSSARSLEAFPDRKLWQRDFAARSTDVQDLVVHRLADVFRSAGHQFPLLPPLNANNPFLEASLTVGDIA